MNLFIKNIYLHTVNALKPLFDLVAPPAIIGVLLQIVGFIVLYRVGASLSDKLLVESEWLPLGISALVIVAGVVVALVSAYPLTFVPQMLALSCFAFSGGMLVRLRSRKFGD